MVDKMVPGLIGKVGSRSLPGLRLRADNSSKPTGGNIAEFIDKPYHPVGGNIREDIEPTIIKIEEGPVGILSGPTKPKSKVDTRLYTFVKGSGSSYVGAFWQLEDDNLWHKYNEGGYVGLPRATGQTSEEPPTKVVSPPSITRGGFLGIPIK